MDFCGIILDLLSGGEIFQLNYTIGNNSFGIIRLGTIRVF